MSGSGTRVEGIEIMFIVDWSQKNSIPPSEKLTWRSAKEAELGRGIEEVGMR